MGPNKILAIKLRSLGDTVLLTAPVVELTRAYPSSEIHLLAMKEWCPVLENLPGVNRIWPYQRHPRRLGRTRGLARLAYQLRRERFDFVVNFHASPSSAALSYATGARVRVNHFHGHQAKNRYSTVEIPGKGILKPIIERDMDCLRALGMHIPAGRLPKVPVKQAEQEDAKVYLSQLGLKKPILGLALGASRPTKTWPLERFADLALQWASKTNGGVLGLVGPGEEHLMHEFLKHLEGLHSRSGLGIQTDFREKIQVSCGLPLKKLAAVLQSLSVLAGNDSGPRHLAVAVGTPTVTLFGPEHPFEWHPYPVDKNPYCFIDELPCRKDADPGMPAWCGLTTCTVEEHKCMRLLGVENVFTQCEKVRGTGP
ncbi:MAG: glycosyltransferase family 9 protein [Bdellovibrio sp.]|nr:glycosyltransferase family 9 protein [Bdellovibrio sp.]